MARFYLFSATFPDGIRAKQIKISRVFLSRSTDNFDLPFVRINFPKIPRYSLSIPLYTSFFKRTSKSVNSGQNRPSKTRKDEEEISDLYTWFGRVARERERYFKSGIKLLKYERILITAGRNYLVSCRESENGTKKRPLMIKDKYDGVGKER